MNARTTLRLSISIPALSLALAFTAFAQDKIDLSVPVFKPKPVVWIDDWKPVEVESDAKREKADGIVGIADRLKSAQQYKKAESTYRLAMEADPTWGYPPYQLACNYELWDKHDKAVPEFKKAIELGFADFPTALSDDELGKLRDADDFPKTLAKIRERYVKTSTAKIGTPIAVKPAGKPPEDGWPLMLMLHGYGDSNVNYLDLARAWAKLGFVAVAVPGSTPNQSGGFIWALDSSEQTLKDLRAILKSDLIEKTTNPKEVHLLGFSQGALHAMLIAARHRDEFKGVVALSPGGSLVQQLVTVKIAAGRPGKLVFIHGEQEPHAPLANLWKNNCTAKGWKYMSKVHSGGHHFPANWEEQRPKIAEFLLK